MTRPVARLYLDQDVDVLWRCSYVRGDMTFETTRDAQLLGEPDDAQLRHAVSSGRAIVTHNRVDFEHLAAEWFERGEEHLGIIIAGRREVHELTRRLLALVAGAAPEGDWNRATLHLA